MDQRGQFTFYRSYYEALKTLPKKEREPVLMAIIAYALDGETTELSGIGSAIFSLVKPTLDTGRKRAESGKQGGSKAEANSKQNESKSQAKDKQPASEKEREKEGEKEKEIENECYNPHTPKAQKKANTPLEEAMDNFAAMRKAMKKPLTDKARDLTLKELEKLAPGDEATQIKILNQSIQRGWQGVFPLKDDVKAAKPMNYDHKDDAERMARKLGLRDG